MIYHLSTVHKNTEFDWTFDQNEWQLFICPMIYGLHLHWLWRIIECIWYFSIGIHCSWSTTERSNNDSNCNQTQKHLFWNRLWLYFPNCLAFAGDTRLFIYLTQKNAQTIGDRATEWLLWDYLFIDHIWSACNICFVGYSLPVAIITQMIFGAAHSMYRGQQIKSKQIFIFIFSKR